MVKFIRLVWEQTNRFWVKRSRFTHLIESLWAPAWKERCKTYIQEQYDRGSKELEDEASQWWKMSLEKLLGAEVEQQTLWLHSVKSAREKYIREEKKNGKQTSLLKRLRIE